MPLLLLFVLLVPGLAHAQQHGQVMGTVRSDQTDEPLGSAFVELVSGNQNRTALTTAEGKYLLRDVPIGRAKLRVHHLGYAPFELDLIISAARDIRLDLALAVAPVPLAAVWVDNRGYAAEDTLVTEAVDADRIGATAMATNSPGLAEIGLAEATRPVAGQEPIDPADVLFVRGAASDFKLVYLDGAPVVSPFPVSGVMDSFQPQLLGSTELFRGGAPARYDGGLTYVLDLNTRALRHDRLRFSGAADLLSARAMVEGPLAPGAAYLISGRGIHRMGLNGLISDPLPFGYEEMLGRMDIDVGETGSVGVMGFLNREAVLFAPHAQPDSAIVWSNAAASVRYRDQIGASFLEVTAAYGQYNASLPLEGERATVISGTSRRSRLAADLYRQIGDFAFRYGAAVDNQEQEYRLSYPQAVLPSATHTVESGASVGAYLDASWQPFRTLRWRGGLRADHFTLDEGITLAPRMAVTWVFDQNAALTLTAGRHHQYLRAPESEVVELRDRGADSLNSRTVPLIVGRASQVGIGLDELLGDGFRLGLKGYFNHFENLPGDGPDISDSSGLDIWIGRTGAALNGWLAYSVSWIWPDRGRTPGRSGFAARHLISAGVDAEISSVAHFGMRITHGAGQPFSSIPVPEGAEGGQFAAAMQLETSPEPQPLPPTPGESYLRLDLTASRVWEPRLNGKSYTIVPYVRVLNALDRRDAVFYRYSRDTDERPQVVAALPLVPLAGLEFRF